MCKYRAQEVVWKHDRETVRYKERDEARVELEETEVQRLERVFATNEPAF